MAESVSNVRTHISFNDLPEEIIEKILHRLPESDTLKLEKVCRTWKKILDAVWEKFSELKLHWDNYVELAEPNNEPKRINYRDGTSDALFCSLIKKIGEKLEKVSIYHTIRLIYFETFLSMLENCPNIKSLRLDRVRSDDYDFVATDNFFKDVFCLKRLDELILFRCRLRDFICGPLDSTTFFQCQLKSLSLQLLNEPVSEESLMPLLRSQSTSLEKFCFQRNIIDGDLLCRCLTKMDNLTHLNIGNYISDENDVSVEENETLLHLTDNNLDTISFNCPKLEMVNLKGMELISSAAVRRLIQQCTMLKFLNLDFCRSVDDEIGLVLRRRLITLPKLEISAFATDLTSASINPSPLTSNWQIMINSECDESMF